ncbi:maleylacetoacetate isomerase [Exilibacterium tricleocarpae]|uniref:Maleylacetoacetate isomerase n=1 Tax=Exilibacterium tricleocarpae TaxID=2591008 RepID=A0A545TNP4_9GAMM|nr:maleylacetoacetate isomerase [Exilibacterium tricleocarpae]TQV78847.1 maleylacetoacetate isomerase [Exilibacterium tricleocarpae]
MELYTYYRSSAAYRVRIALNLKGIAHRLVPVDLLAGEHHSDSYKAIQPQGFVPALKTERGDYISQSTAILEYLEAQYPQPPLLPADSYAAATVRSWASIIACDIHPLNNLRVLKYLTGELQVDEQQKNTWYRHWIETGFTALESQVRAAPYCFGEQVTLADVYLVPQVYNARRFDTDMTAYPKIEAICAACNGLPAFDKAKPESQADAP